jgi:hypothetical protein
VCMALFKAELNLSSTDVRPGFLYIKVEQLQ